MMTNLGVELCNKFEMSLEVCSEDGLYDEEAEPFKLGLVQVTQPVIGGAGHEEVPGGGSVVAL